MARGWLNSDQIHAPYSETDTGFNLSVAPVSVEDELGYLHQQIKSITAQSTWRTAPARSLEAVADNGVTGITFNNTASTFSGALLDTVRRKIFSLIKDSGVNYVASGTSQAVDVSTQMGAVAASTTAPTYNSGTRTWSDLGAVVYSTDAANHGVVRNSTGVDPVTDGSGNEIHALLSNKKVVAQPVNTTGVSVQYVAQETVAGNLVFTLVGTTLAYEGGTPVNVGAGGLFKLVGGTSGFIIVDVTPASLPVTFNHTDGLTFSATYMLGFFKHVGADEVPYKFSGTTNVRVQAALWVAGSSTLLEDATVSVGFNATAVDVTETLNISQLASDAGVTLSGTGAHSLSYSGTSYLNAITNLKAATVALDTAINSLGSGSTTAISNLQTYTGSTGNTDVSPNYTSNVYVTDGTSLLAAISALDAALNTDAGALTTHINNATGAHAASAISITSGQATALGAASQTVAAALTALDDTLDAHIVDSTDPHGATLTQTNLTVTATFAANGNSTIGDASGDTLTVNATSTFVAAATFQGDVTLGNASGDALTVVATSSFQNDVTLGSSSADALTINAASTLKANMAVDTGITIDGVDLSAFKAEYDTHVAGTADQHYADKVLISGGLQTAIGSMSANVDSALSKLDDRLDTVEASLGGGAIASEIADLYTKAGVPAYGTSLTYSGTSYLDAVTTLKGADLALDTALSVGLAAGSALLATYETEHWGNFVATGLAVSVGTGTAVNVSAGTAYVNGVRYAYGTVTNHAVTANATNYVYINSSGVVIYSTTAPTGTFLQLATVAVSMIGVPSTPVDTRQMTLISPRAAKVTGAFEVTGAATFDSTVTSTGLVTASAGVQTATVSGTAALNLTAATNMLLTDARVTNVKLSNADTTLLSPTGGIVDALNEAFRGSVKERGTGAGTGVAAVNLNTVCGITTYYSNRGGTGAGATAEGFYAEVLVNGVLQIPGAGNDYRESVTTGTGQVTITFIGKTPNSNDTITAIVYRL